MGVHPAPPILDVCQGCVLDVIVDIRAGSPPFGLWNLVELDVRARRAVYLSEVAAAGLVLTYDERRAFREASA